MGGDGASAPLTPGQWIQEIFWHAHLPGRLYLISTVDGVRVTKQQAHISSDAVVVPDIDWTTNDVASYFLPWNKTTHAVGSWLELCIGKYRGDIGYVIGASTMSDGLVLAIVPRLNISAPERRKKQRTGGVASTARKQSRRAAPDLFVPTSEAKSIPISKGGLRELFSKHFVCFDRKLIQGKGGMNVAKDTFAFLRTGLGPLEEDIRNEAVGGEQNDERR